MRQETKILSIIMLVSAAILIAGVFFLTKSSSNTTPETTVYQINYDRGQKIGSESAKLKIVEFSDFQCPACALYNSTLEGIVSTNSTDIQLYYRHFPLPQHTNAWKAANTAESAGVQGKFWQMHDKLFETQQEWSSLPDPTDYFTKLAKDLNLNENKVREDITSDAFKDKIQKDIEEGNSLQIQATPTFFINGKKFMPKSTEDLKATIEQALKAI